MKHLKASFLLAAAVASIHAHAQSMTDLGTLGGDEASANAISANGLAVAGYASNILSDRAFRWTSAGGMENLGTLPGGSFSDARGISANGLVVVGSADNASNQRHAFRWTSAGGMENLGALGGYNSTARAVSADGAVVVGEASNASFQDRAFRWTSTGGMENLGTFGGDFSFANGVSADGLVIVGEAQYPDYKFHAFICVLGNFMASLGTLPGGDYSSAKAVSADGAVVVGEARNASSQYRAFRWTQANGMTDLGTFGGTYSSASGVSADGAVVVGSAENASNQRHAFRWTQANGMADLGTFGGDFSSANAVSADGNVVVGSAENANRDNRAFLYSHRVMLDVQDWLGSVGGVNSLLSSSLELSRSSMEGAHHRPLAELGRGRSYWVTGDIASSSRTRDLRTRSGEAGVTFEPAANVLIGIGAGYGRQDRNLANGGSGATDGQYLVGEVDLIQADGGIFSLLVSAGDWRSVTDRAYVTGSGIESSHGETDLASTAFRLRYDSPVLTKALGADLKTYISYSQSKARSDAYAETGGSFAGSFGELKQTAKEGRLGVAATRSFTEKLRGRLSAEWIRRFDSDQAILTATDITSTLELSLPGAPVVRDQARFGFDLDYLMDAKTTLSFTVHAAGRGESADVSGAISLRRGF